MPLLKAVADNLSNNELVAGVIEEIITRDELFALLPWVGVNGKAYVYNRESAANESNENLDFIAPGDQVPEHASSVDSVTTTLKILIGDVDVDNFLQEVESDTNDQKATQIALKAKYLGRKFRNMLVNGSTAVNSKQFDGIDVLAKQDSGQVLSAGTNGGALTLDLMDNVLDLLPNGADALMMHSRTIRKLRALLRATGGTRAHLIEIEYFGLPVFPCHAHPVIRNDYISIAQTQGSGTALTSIYAMRLNELDGFHAIWGGKDAGIRVEDIGTVQDHDATRTRLKWYCGTALKSPRSLAVLTGVQ